MRREQLLVAVFGPAAAVEALAKPIGVDWLLIMVSAIAVLGAIADSNTLRIVARIWADRARCHS
jgi:hypothetical protein